MNLGIDSEQAQMVKQAQQTQLGIQLEDARRHAQADAARRLAEADCLVMELSKQEQAAEQLAAEGSRQLEALRQHCDEVEHTLGQNAERARMTQQAARHEARQQAAARVAELEDQARGLPQL